MSEASIQLKIKQIEDETQINGNTKERVGAVLRDLNTTKENKDTSDQRFALHSTQILNLQTLKADKLETYNIINSLAERVDILEEGKADKTETEEKFNEVFLTISSLAWHQNQEFANLDNIKLDKPTDFANYPYVILYDPDTKASGYTNRNSIGANLGNSDLSLESDRTVYFDGKSLRFTNNAKLGINVGESVPFNEQLAVIGNTSSYKYLFSSFADGLGGIPNAMRSNGTDLYYMNSAGVERKIGYGLKYKSYAAIIEFDPTTLDPITTTLDNELGSIIWTKVINGEYTGTLVSGTPFDAAKTTIHCSNRTRGDQSFLHYANVTSASTIFLNIRQAITTGTSRMSAGYSMFIEIKTYN